MSGESPTLETLRAWLRASEITARPGGDCPAPETLWSAATGELAPRATRSIVAHSATCGACSEAWRLALDLGEVAGRTPRRASGTRNALLIGGLLAASLVAAAWLGIPTRWMGAPVPDYRDQPGTPTITARVDDGATIPREAFTLRWSAVPSALAYDVEIASEDLLPLETIRGLTTPEHRVPPAALAAVPDGALVVWRVTARLPRGETVRSVAFLARVGAGPRR